MKRKTSTILMLALLLIIFSPPVSAKILVDENPVVSLGGYKAYSFNTSKDDSLIYLSIKVFDGSVDVLVHDELGYEMFIHGFPSPPLSIEKISGKGKFSVELGPAGLYYVLVYNTYTIPSVEVTVVVTVRTVEEIIGIFVGSIVGFGAVIAGVWTFYHFKVKRAGKKLEQK